MKARTASCLLLVFCWLISLPAAATGIIQTVIGSVRAGPSETAAKPATQGQALTPGTFVVTGPGSRATLRFDDGQAIVLNENSAFRVREYNFAQNAPAQDRFVFDFLRGAMRSVTALVTRRNLKAYALHIPQATIGIRGTDFMIAVVNPGFGQVLDGALDVVNSGAGGAPASFAVPASPTFTVASDIVQATFMPASSFPALVSTWFSQLSALTLTAAAGAAGEAGATVATEVGAGGITAGALGAGALGLGVLMGIGSGGDAAQSGTTTTTTTVVP